MNDTGKPARQQNATAAVTRKLLHRALVLGEKAAEDEFFRLVFTDVVKFVQSAGRPKGLPAQDDDDVVQTVVLKIMRLDPQRLLDARSFPDWLFTVTKNAVMDVLRIRKRRLGREVSLDKPLGTDAEGTPATMLDFLESMNPSQADLHAQRELRESLVDDFLPRLSKEDQKILRLYLQGMPQKQIAEEVNRLLSNVGVKLFRIREKASNWRSELEL